MMAFRQTELVESYLQQGLKSKDPSFDMDEFSSMLTYVLYLFIRVPVRCVLN